MMDGRALAARVREEVARDVDALGGLRLATVLVGDDAASEVYIRHKHTAAREVGIEPIDHRLASDVLQGDVLDLVARLNHDDAVDGVLVQTPLPQHVDELDVTSAVAAVKDVDGFHPWNVGRLVRGRPTLVPATALGIMALLEEYAVALAGRRAVVVGRSDRVGRPLLHLLLQRHATVTVCHSGTVDLARETLAGDVVVAAVGSPGVIGVDMVKSGAAVVDVGITRTEEGLVGDVDPGVADRAGAMTPVPGGVGPMTIAMLLANTVRAARYRRGGLAVAPACYGASR
jgi:methylenetetrahydrofolate dehydrogenase (NADP+) / methenyltetrahydrofolate cyclohydrolase